MIYITLQCLLTNSIGLYRADNELLKLVVRSFNKLINYKMLLNNNADN
jgi:hypothetical protein